MEIIEKTIIGKVGNPILCEDGLFIGENFMAVVDGVTSKGDFLWANKKSGVFAKNLVLNYLETIPLDITAQKLIEGINKIFFEQIKRNKLIKDTKEHLRASIIVYSKYHKEIWSYGDCQCMINGKLYNHFKKVDELIANVRSFVIQSLLMKGMTIEELQIDDISRDFIRPLLEKQLLFENANSEYGYSVLNGRLLENYNAKVYRVKSGDEVILASDGYPKLYSSLKDSESYLSYILAVDPLCYSLHKSTKGIMEGNKSFDDRAYLKFII